MEIFVARGRDGEITAICDNADTAEKLRDLIDDNVETVTIPHESKGNVFTIIDKSGTERFAPNEADAIEMIVSTPEIQFREGSTFYGMSDKEAKAAMQEFLDTGHMANEFTEDLDEVVISAYVVNTIYSNVFYGKDIDMTHEKVFGKTTPKNKNLLEENVFEWYISKHPDALADTNIKFLRDKELTFQKLLENDMKTSLTVDLPDFSPGAKGETISAPLTWSIQAEIVSELTNRMTQMGLKKKETLKMANEKNTVVEKDTKEIELKNELAADMASKAAEGKAVWQVPKDERPIMHTPVNPRSGNYFQNGTALILMQAQYEKKTADNRWISAKALNVLREKEKLDIAPSKGETATRVVSGGKVVPYFNYSQLHGKDLPRGIEIIDKTKDSYGEYMLNYMAFKPTQAKEKTEVTKETFWDLGKKAQYSAMCFAEKLKNELEQSMSVFEPVMPEFEKRLNAIKQFDRNAKPKNNEEQFMHSMAWSLTRNPEKNNFVMKAAASALIKQVPEKEVIKLIDKLAPEAAKDSVKLEQGKTKYSAFVMGALKQDKELAKKIEAGKNKSVAR